MDTDEQARLHAVPYLSADPADANWMQILRGYLEPDGITPTEKGRKLAERLDREREEYFGANTET